MAAKGGKKGKKKGTTMALTDFLSDDQGNVAGPGTSYVLANKPVDWATEMDELDSSPDTYASSIATAVNRAKLPTGPKASRGPEDLERVPTQPPFKAFIGNLPYEVSEESIENFFRNLPVKNVQLVLDSGRFKGFGYVEFENRQALIEALGMSEEMLGGRKTRIDLAEKHNEGGSRQGGGRQYEDGPDRTEGDWRREGPPSGPPSSRYDDGGSGGRGGFDDRGGPRGSSYDDRAPREERAPREGTWRGADDHGSRGGFDDRGSRGGFDDRGPRGGYDDRGSRGGFDDRGPRGGFDDRGPRGYDDRGSRGFDDRGGGSWGFSRGGDDRGQRYDDRGPSRGFEDRDGGRRGYGSSFERDRDRGGYGGDRGGSAGADRGWERSGQSAVTARPREERAGGYERPDNRGGESEAPKERPRLQLQPRSKPAEKPASGDASLPSIFGSAKPVDTAQREREIEERLMKKKADPVEKKSSLESRGYGGSKGYEETPDRRQDSADGRNMSKPEGGSRRRSDSDRSSEGDRRERRSSGRGRKTSGGSGGRPYKDGDHSGPSDPVSPGDEYRDEKTVVSPVHRDEAKNLIPAPPPKENIWEKRKTTAVVSPPKSAPETRGAPPTSPPAVNAESRSNDSLAAPEPRSPTQQSQNQSVPQAQPQSYPAEPSKKEFVPAEPPKENPWTKRRQEQAPAPQSPPASDNTAPSGRGHSPASSSGPPSGPPNAWGGRGAGARGRGGRGAGPGMGRGRGEQKPKEKKERALPQSIDEMPKLETKSKKDFSDGNKFAGLIDDDDGDYEVES